MDSEERDIFNYLKSWGKEYVGAAEICRRAGTKKLYATNPEWAVIKLQLMLERGILERDQHGRYRIKPKAKHKKGGRWISPEIQKILHEKGVAVDINQSEGEVGNVEDYEHL